MGTDFVSEVWAMVYHGLPYRTVRVWWWAAWAARRVSEVKNEISAKVVYRPLHCTRVTLGGVGVHWRAVGATMVDFRNISKIAYFTLPGRPRRPPPHARCGTEGRGRP